MERKTTRPTFAAICLSVLTISGCAKQLDRPEDFVQVAYVHERAGDFAQAVIAYRKSLELNPQQPVTWYDLGVSYAAMEQFHEAIEAYTKSIELDASSARPFNNRAAAYARLKLYEKAIADCSKAIDLDPNDFLAWRNRALARHDNGDLENALTDYDESIRINGKIAETYHSRGNVFLDQKQYRRALEDFDQAILLENQMAAAHLSRAISLARLGRESDAVAARRKAEEFGSSVDDVIIADLLPGAGKSFDEEALDLHIRSVNFVRGELLKTGLEVDNAAEPFDLQDRTGESKTKYVVRTVFASDKDAVVSFTVDELKQIESQGPSTTLLIVQVTESEKKEEEAAEPEAYRILRRLEKWAPDTSHMQPVAWGLPVQDAESPPVAAATP